MHRLLQLGQRGHEPAVDQGHQHRKEAHADQDDREGLQIERGGGHAQRPAGREDEDGPAHRAAGVARGGVLPAVHRHQGVLAGELGVQPGDVFGHSAGGHRLLVGGGDQPALGVQHVHLRAPVLGLLGVELVEHLLLDGKEVHIGVAAFERRVDPAAAQHHMVPAHLAVAAGGEEIFPQGVKVKPAQLVLAVHPERRQLLQQEADVLVDVQKIQHVLPPDHIDGVDLLILHQPRVALEHRAVGVDDGVLPGDPVVAIVPLQHREQPLVGGEGVRDAVDPLDIAVDAGADILRGVAQGLGLGLLLGAHGGPEQEGDGNQHRHKTARQRQQHPGAQAEPFLLHSPLPRTAR